MVAIYNENASYPVQWLRNLIEANYIAPGLVDERSIVDLQPCDVSGHGQRHFFAGIGVWSHALQLAGWPDDRDIWTGSCPCQPFSSAGRGRGVDDERHLWPEWFRLIRECRPPIVVGEQVASPAGLGWIDAVSTDLEGAGYAVGAADLCAAGVGAPHIRQRLFFVAISDDQQGDLHAAERQQGRGLPDARWNGPAGLMADLRGARLEVVREQQARGKLPAPERGGSAVVMSHDPTGRRCEGQPDAPPGTTSWMAYPNEPNANDEREQGIRGLVQPPQDATTGFWHPADWIPCADGRSRPVEPGTFPLAHGATARVGRLRAYGNAIVAPLAAEFIRAVIEQI